ncbi:hypothetical protein Plhal304r1_c088g0170341 [Plasmopara halstedii]
MNIINRKLSNHPNTIKYYVDQKFRSRARSFHLNCSMRMTFARKGLRELVRLVMITNEVTEAWLVDDVKALDSICQEVMPEYNGGYFPFCLNLSIAQNLESSLKHIKCLKYVFRNFPISRHLVKMAALLRHVKDMSFGYEQHKTTTTFNVITQQSYIRTKQFDK